METILILLYIYIGVELAMYHKKTWDDNQRVFASRSWYHTPKKFPCKVFAFTLFLWPISLVFLLKE